MPCVYLPGPAPAVTVANKKFVKPEGIETFSKSEPIRKIFRNLFSQYTLHVKLLVDFKGRICQIFFHILSIYGALFMFFCCKNHF